MRAIRHPSLDDIQLTDIMFALSDPERVRIVQSLASEKRPMTCLELTGARPKSTLSRHFKVLREAGILFTAVDGKEHLNSLRLAEVERRFPGLMRSILRELREGR